MLIYGLFIRDHAISINKHTKLDNASKFSRLSDVILVNTYNFSEKLTRQVHWLDDMRCYAYTWEDVRRIASKYKSPGLPLKGDFLSVKSWSIWPTRCVFDKVFFYCHVNVVETLLIVLVWDMSKRYQAKGTTTHWLHPKHAEQSFR